MSKTTTFSTETDEELARKVNYHLLGQQLPALRRLKIDVHCGIVTLRGAVRLFYEQQIVQQCCRELVALAPVINEVVVLHAQQSRPSNN